MRADELLTALEALAEPVALVPEHLDRSHGYPLTATEMLRGYRRYGKHYLEAEVPSTADMKQIYLEPWGWLRVREARVVDAGEEQGGPFETGRAVAYAIAAADDIVKPVPLGKRWLLAHAHREGLPPTFVTAAFWLRTRHACFMAAVADYAVEEVLEEPPVPLIVLRQLTAPPNEIIQ